MQVLRLCFLSFWLFFCCLVSASGQVALTASLEIELTNKTGDDVRVYPAGSQGVVLIHHIADPNPERKRELKIELYDTLLQKKWSLVHPVPLSMLFSTVYLSSADVFLLLSPERYEYELLKVRISDGLSVLYKLDGFKKLDISHFAGQDSMAFLAGTLYDKPVVFFHNLRSNKTTAPASLSTIEGKIAHLHIDSLNRQVWVLAKGDQRELKNKIFVNRFSHEGVSGPKWVIDREDFYQPVQMRFLSQPDSSLIALGTYAHRGETATQGLFFLKFKAGEPIVRRNYDFGFFSHFFYYLPEKRRNKLTAKAKSYRDRGKIYPIRQRLLLHQPILTPEGNILLIGESYQSVPVRSHTPLSPNYFNRLYPYYGAYGWSGSYRVTPIPTDPIVNYSFVPSFLSYPDHSPEREAIVEYSYDHSMVACFAASGKKLWDNSLVLNKDEKLPIELSGAALAGDSLVMLAVHLHSLCYKSSLPNDFEAQNREIKTEPDSVIVDERLNGGLGYWYEKNFIQTGIREQRLKGQSIFKTKRLFFLNRWSIRWQ